MLVENNLNGDQIINLFSRGIPSNKFMDQQEISVFLVFTQPKQKVPEEKLLNLTTYEKENLMAERSLLQGFHLSGSEEEIFRGRPCQ